MDNLVARWASLGAYVVGDVNPYEDPEKLLVDTVSNLSREGRLLEIMVSWLSKFGHLVLTKKLRFANARQRRLFSAIIEVSHTNESKLRRMISRGRVVDAEHLYGDLPNVLKQASEKDADPVFLKHGFIVPSGEKVRESIILPAGGVYDRSAVLRNRALYGPTLRSDLVGVFPEIGPISLTQLARRLHVAPATLHPVICDYERSGLIEKQPRTGPKALLIWKGSPIKQAA